MAVSTSSVVVPGKPAMAVVEERSGEKVRGCYQCGNCSSTCPAASIKGIDYTPRQIMRALQLGQLEEVLGSSFIWVCLSCQTCVVRCPREIEVSRVMDTLRQLAREKGVRPSEADIATFHSSFLELVKRGGRLYEVGLIGMMNLRTGKPFANASLGLPMLSKGKVPLLPSRSKGAGAAKRIFDKVSKVERI